MTSADVKEIQDRNAAARGRVLSAPYGVVEAENIPDVQYTARIIETAMMELATVWREEAAHVTAAGRKGHVGIAKEYTMAASRLAGFAVGLTTRPVTRFGPDDGATLGEDMIIVDDPHPPQCDCGRPACVALELPEGCSHPAEALSVRKDGTTLCTACREVWNMDITPIDPHGEDGGGALAFPAAELPAMWEEADLIGGLTDALPEGDPVAEIFGGAMTAENPERLVSFMRGETNDPGVMHAKRGGIQFPTAPLTGDEPVGTKVTVGGVEFTKIGTDPFGVRQDSWTPQASEEQNLRDIIGPLGASTVTATIDHPFTNPGSPWLNRTRAVETLSYAQLPVIAAATPARGHVSHSYVESYEGCSLSAMLRDASRFGQIGASRPGWSMIGGTAFHAAVELIERLALSGVTLAEDAETLWTRHFETAVKERMDELAGTPYADSTTWYISNRGKEGYDWWRVEGAKMLALYVKYHNDAWRAANPTFLLQDKTPVIELAYAMSIRSLDGERGLTAQGFVDRATLDMGNYSLTVLDYKTGAREPESTFQLGEYGHALLMAMDMADQPPERPILGRYWLARKGIYTDAVQVVTRHPLDELQYRYDAAARGTKAGVFSPHVTNLCKSCSVADYCPAQAGRS